MPGDTQALKKDVNKTNAPQYFDDSADEYRYWPGYEKPPSLPPTGTGELTIAATNTPEPLVATSFPCRFVTIHTLSGNAAAVRIAGLSFAADRYDTIPINNANDIEVEGAAGDKVEYRILL